MKNGILILLSFFLTTVSTLKAQSTAAYEAILQSYFPSDGPGVAALVAKDGKVLYSGGIGFASLELDVPMNANHVFRIGSVTKQFTAVAILMLQEQGKLNLQDEITKYLPDYPVQGKKITIEHLLTHTSGIQSYTNLPSFMDFASKTMSQEDMLNVFKDEPMEFDPGTEYKYNNSGYYLLGVIIEKISGLSYADFLQKYIFDVAGMKDSYYGGHSPIIKNRAAGYAQGDDGFVNAEYISMDWPYAAGAILSTVGDLLKWNTALHDGKFVKTSTLEKAFVDYKLANGESTNYGYGWSITKMFDSKSYEHSGGVHGFLAYAMYVPKEKIFVAALSNCTCQETGGVSAALAAQAMGKTPQRISSIELNAAMMEDYIGTYEIKPGDERQVMIKDGKLFSQRTGGESKLTAYAKDKFSIEKSLTTFEFIRDASGKVSAMKSYTRTGNEETAKRTSNKPKLRKEIAVDQKILDAYVGSYEIVPNFAIDITTKDGQLYLQATGQQKFPAFAESETKFFLKVVNAQIEFFEGEDGSISKLILYQNGQEMPGIKK